MVCLLDLPPECLEVVASGLNAKSRVFFLATCRKLRQLEGSSRFWEDVRAGALRSQQALLFACWLHPRLPGMRRLSLTARADDSLGNPALFTCGLLAGSRLLQSLELETDALELGSWLCSLPALCRLKIVAWGPLTLRSHLAWATSLRELRIFPTHALTLEPSCMPPTLEEAEFCRPPAAILASLAPATATLRALTLSDCGDALDLAPLRALSGLTSLALDSCRLGFVPPQLSGLTTLRALSMRNNRIEEGWHCLLPLVRLTRLDLDVQHRAVRVPNELLALPELEVLMIGCNTPTDAIPRPPVPSPLRTLAIDFEVAARSHASLACMTSLRQLRLVSAAATAGAAGGVGSSAGAGGRGARVLVPRLEDATALLRLIAASQWRVRWLAVNEYDHLKEEHSYLASDPLQMAALALRVVQAYPRLAGMRLT